MPKPSRERSRPAALTVRDVTFMTAGSPSNIGNVSSGTSIRTFNTSGAYQYHCTNHPGMEGTVNVQ